MDHLAPDLESALSLQALLGYLNFSEGKPDPRFQKQINDAYRYFAERGEAKPWQKLQQMLLAKLTDLRQSGSGAFHDATQADAVLQLVFDQALPAYQQHHADLLSHLSDDDLFQPFFVARVCEAVLQQGGPWQEQDRIIGGALRQLNDFVGHRPIAILETRPKGEPYGHEEVRPIPLFIRGAGVAWGRYHDLIAKALEILQGTNADVLAEAGFDPELLDELSLDPRAYDHGHPVNRRPNYIFGEWDPHHIDNQGRYRRFVVRQVTLDALLERAKQAKGEDAAPLLFEGSAVLAGTMLMAAGISGEGPVAHDSSTTLASLMPRIARYRDAFYANLLTGLEGPHADRLREEAARTKQPFGEARRHLNQYVARQRALQLQQRHLALVFAQLGYPEPSQAEAARVPTVSGRMLSQVQAQLTTGHLLLERGELEPAADVLPTIEDLLERGIQCGAIVDPWNILGFQGQFPLAAAQEDTVRDHRIDELLGVMQQVFGLYSRLMCEAAATGKIPLNQKLSSQLRRRATWWDRFASSEVSGLPRVHGGDTAESAEHVAKALRHWHERGAATADLAFWKQHLQDFTSPKAFALVVKALLDNNDYRAAMALLMNWLSQAGQVPLQEGEYSFHALALRWMAGLVQGGPIAAAERWPLVKKFFDYLEANAEDLWDVPHLERANGSAADREESLYEAAYEGVTYRDSADDGKEGSVADGGPLRRDFPLEFEADPLGKRLHFLATVARLWHLAARQAAGTPIPENDKEVLHAWLAAAESKLKQLLVLLDAIHDCPVPEPLGSHDSVVEFDGRRTLKHRLLGSTIITCLETFRATRTLRGSADVPAPSKEPEGAAVFQPDWEPLAIRLEQALVRGDAELACKLLPEFAGLFQKEPLLYKSLETGGFPRPILRVRIMQATLRTLLSALPRIGLLRETYHLLKIARSMEKNTPPEGLKTSDFEPLFQMALAGVVEAVVRAVTERDQRSSEVKESGEADRTLVRMVEAFCKPFLPIWVEHSQGLRLSVLDTLKNDSDWQKLRRFIQQYGRDLFQARFMTLANLRGILHRGVGAYLDSLQEDPDPLHPVRLLEDLGQTISRAEAVRLLECTLQAIVENYEEYKDYNTTTTQSDYGENLHVLLDFLRVKARYERHAWVLRPVVLVHGILARHGRTTAALLWQKAFSDYTRKLADQHLEQLARLEQQHSMRLASVADRLQERFVQPLAVDRLCSLVEPAYREARQGQPGEAFARLQQELKPFMSTAGGSGLDVPTWLRRLESEAWQLRVKETAPAPLLEGEVPVPSRPLSIAELKQQLQDWNKPLVESE